MNGRREAFGHEDDGGPNEAVSVRPASAADADAVVPLLLALPGGVREIFRREAVARRVARAMFVSDRTVFSARHALVARTAGLVSGVLIRMPEPEWVRLRVGSGPVMLRAARGWSPALIWRGTRQDRLMPAVPRGFLYVPALSVAPASRRQGIGGLLLRRAVDEAERRQLPGVALDVAEDNAGAISLYERFGFEAVERRSIPSGRGLAHLSSLRMELRLPRRA